MTKWANPETVKWWRRRSKRRRRRIDNLPEKDGRWVGRGGDYWMLVADAGPLRL